jgi:hypothetical protein
MLAKKNASSESIVKSMFLVHFVTLDMSEHTRKGLLFHVNLQQRSIISTIITTMVLGKTESRGNIMMITPASKVQFLVASVVLVSVLLLPEVMVVSGQSL